MSSEPRRHRGFTLIEMIVAIVVIGVGLSGVLAVFSTTVGKSADPLVRKQMLTAADDLMEEILLKPYADAANSAPAQACGRETFNDVDDYENYSTTGKICDVDGTPIDALNGFSVLVRVQSDNLGGVTAALKITITVSRGTESFQLVGWRTGYAT